MECAKPTGLSGGGRGLRSGVPYSVMLVGDAVKSSHFGGYMCSFDCSGSSISTHILGGWGCAGSAGEYTLAVSPLDERTFRRSACKYREVLDVRTERDLCLPSKRATRCGDVILSLAPERPIPRELSAELIASIGTP